MSHFWAQYAAGNTKAIIKLWSLPGRNSRFLGLCIFLPPCAPLLTLFYRAIFSHSHALALPLLLTPLFPVWVGGEWGVKFTPLGDIFHQAGSRYLMAPTAVSHFPIPPPGCFWSMHLGKLREISLEIGYWRESLEIFNFKRKSYLNIEIKCDYSNINLNFNIFYVLGI